MGVEANLQSLRLKYQQHLTGSTLLLSHTRAHTHTHTHTPHTFIHKMRKEQRHAHKVTVNITDPEMTP